MQSLPPVSLLPLQRLVLGLVPRPISIVQLSTLSPLVPSVTDFEFCADLRGWVVVIFLALTQPKPPVSEDADLVHGRALSARRSRLFCFHLSQMYGISAVFKAELEADGLQMLPQTGPRNKFQLFANVVFLVL
ncbi:hypothetical protein K438DRAFT_105845 [Mycena galopus ATCC 62051]|nr:hypothetical protein K438DRAFT_105845 [Mycena galopus ATCC 62051]